MKDKGLRKLVGKAANGSETAFSELCGLKAREIVYLCVLEMHNQHDGEDAAQEVFIRMQKYITNLKSPDAFNVWLNRLVHNTCYNMKRDSMRYRNTTVEEFDIDLQEETPFSFPQEYAEDAELRESIADAIQNMPEKYRSPLILHYYQGLSYNQIAQVLQLSQHSVNNNMRMGRKYLEHELNQRTQYTKASHIVVPMLAVAPLLALCLRESSARIATPSVISRCLAGAKVPYHPAPKPRPARTLGMAALAVSAGAALTVGLLMIPKPSLDDLTSPPAAKTSLPAPPNTQAQDAQVSGTIWVADSSGNKGGLAGATVELVQKSDGAVLQQGTTRLDGAFLFSTVPFAEYTLMLHVPGHKTPVAVLLGPDESFHITRNNCEAYMSLNVMVNLTSTVSGRISFRSGDEDLPYDGQVLPGVNMQLLDPQGALVAETQVYANGNYRFENLLIRQMGSYTLRVSVDTQALGEDIQIEDMPIELYPGFGN